MSAPRPNTAPSRWAKHDDATDPSWNSTTKPPTESEIRAAGHELAEAFYRIGELHSRYVDVHRSFFRKSRRHTIPILGFFKPFNYQQHFESLRFIEMSLKRAVADMAKSPLLSIEIPAAFFAFASSLLDSITHLRLYCGNLSKRASVAFDYSIADHQRDYDNFVESFERTNRLRAEYCALLGHGWARDYLDEQGSRHAVAEG